MSNIKFNQQFKSGPEGRIMLTWANSFEVAHDIQNLYIDARWISEKPIQVKFNWKRFRPMYFFTMSKPNNPPKL